MKSENPDVADQLILDYRLADLDAADRALCDYALKLTLRPGDMGPDDVERLRRHGFDDDAVTIAVQVIGYFNYINRVADGLGVDPEEWMTMGSAEWKARKGVFSDGASKVEDAG